MDMYLGSGKIIKKAVRKYGKKAFQKEILHVVSTSEEAYQLEAQLIAECRQDVRCYNLHEGGSGGFERINMVYRAQQKKASRRGYEVRTVKRLTDPEFADNWRKNATSGLRKKMADDPTLVERWRINARQNQPKAVKAWKGQKHTLKSRKSMSASHKGEKNWGWGARWMITPNGDSQRVLPVNLESRLFEGWVFGRRVSGVQGGLAERQGAGPENQ